MLTPYHSTGFTKSKNDVMIDRLIGLNDLTTNNFKSASELYSSN